MSDTNKEIMMKHLTGWLVCAAALLSFGSAQGFQSYTFGEIKWLSAPAVVVAAQTNHPVRYFIIVSLISVRHRLAA